jgi:hypothetical protein
MIYMIRRIILLSISLIQLIQVSTARFMNVSNPCFDQNISTNETLMSYAQTKYIEFDILSEEMKMAIILVLFLGAMYIMQRKK